MASQTADAIKQLTKTVEGMQNSIDSLKDATAAAKRPLEEELKIVKEKTKSRAQLLAQEHEEKQSRRLMTVATRGQHPAFGLLSGLAGQKFEGASRLSDLERMENQGMGLSDEQRKTKSQLIEQGVDKSAFKPMFDIFNKHFGQGSKWDKQFGGHGKTAAMGLGMGAVGGGLALGKMIFDSSPMMQQMFKLLKFGIMMVLRPIGDFFGFVMRPILLVLLRKFILPWYSKMYPVMLKMGTDIGNMVAGTIDKTEQAVDFLFSPNQQDTIMDALSGAVHELFKAAGSDIPIDATWSEVVGGWFKDLKNPFEIPKAYGETGALDKLPDILTKWQESWDSFTTFFSSLQSGVTGWVKDRWDSFTSFFSDIGHINDWIGWAWDKFKNFFRDTLGGIWDTLGSAWNSFVGFWFTIKDTFKYILGLIGFNPVESHAHGGMINEPIFGVGKSGKHYSFGEHGSEMIIPTKGGVSSEQSIVINIENMSGSQQDLTNLRRTILQVVQESNARRGRI